MKKLFGKKQLLLGGLVLALGAAVYLNYSFARPAASSIAASAPTAPTGESRTDDHLGDALYVGNTTAPASTAYFAQARQNRENARQEAIDMIKDLLGSAKVSGDVQTQIAKRMQEMADAVDRESKIENLIKAKGFADCVVYIADEKCSVVVPGETLDAVKTAQITDIVTAQSDVAAKNIAITTVKS
ncbi:MAG: SpoIIIAH-like family protein [Acutalibacteraceae bacterium]|jgi:stage III sporulation protein AH